MGLSWWLYHKYQYLITFVWYFLVVRIVFEPGHSPPVSRNFCWISNCALASFVYFLFLVYWRSFFLCVSYFIWWTWMLRLKVSPAKYTSALNVRDSFPSNCICKMQQKHFLRMSEAYQARSIVDIRGVEKRSTIQLCWGGYPVPVPCVG